MRVTRLTDFPGSPAGPSFPCQERELTFKTLTEKCTKPEMSSVWSIQGSKHSATLSHDEGWGLFFGGRGAGEGREEGETLDALTRLGNA